MANIFDDPAPAAVPSATSAAVIPAATVSQPATPAQPAPAEKKETKKKLNLGLGRPAIALGLLLYAAIVFGALGQTFPGSGYADQVAQVAGKWFFEVVTGSSYTNAGYALVGIAVALVCLTWMTARSRK